MLLLLPGLQSVSPVELRISLLNVSFLNGVSVLTLDTSGAFSLCFEHVGHLQLQEQFSLLDDALVGLSYLAFEAFVSDLEGGLLLLSRQGTGGSGVDRLSRLFLGLRLVLLGFLLIELLFDLLHQLLHDRLLELLGPLTHLGGDFPLAQQSLVVLLL